MSKKIIKNSKTGTDDVFLCIRLPKEMYMEIEKLVKEKKYPSKAEFIRHAIRRLLLYEKYREWFESEKLVPVFC